MYKGYRVKINGITIDDTMVIKGSYSAKKSRRVLTSYYDAAGFRHEELSQRETCSIKMQIRSRNAEEHSWLMGALRKKEQAEVEYWDDEIQTYSIGFFKINDYDVSHRHTAGGIIHYGELSLSLEEY